VVDRTDDTPPRTAGGPPTLRVAALTALLAAILFVALARFADRHLSARIDLSEDGLSGWSATTERVLDQLDDLLSVELFITGEPEHAVAQLHRRRLLDAFDEFEDLAASRARVVLSDPNSSYPDRLRAERLRIRPTSLQEQAGTSRVEQDVYFGAVLRYRGAEQVLPFLHPVTLEYDVASAIARLVRGRPARIGWYVGRVPVPAEDGSNDGPSTRTDQDFTLVRAHLATRFEVVDVYGLANGVRVPADLDALCVLAPRDLGPRAAFEIEEFVRSGKGLLLLADRSRALVEARRVEDYDTGLESLLEAWGAPSSPRVLWDRTSSYKVETRSSVGGSAASIDYPLWNLVQGAGGPPEGSRFDTESPVTARLGMLLLRWAHPLEPGDVPTGLVRRALAESSENSWIIPLQRDIRPDAATVDATTRQLIASRDPAARHDLVVALEGRFPALDDGATGPPAADPTTGAPVAGTERTRRTADAVATRVAVVGDADWARDEVVAGPEGLSIIGQSSAAFMDNVVDWLVQSDELVALRARVPKDRRLVDFEARALEAAGVVESEGPTGMTRRAEQARRVAARERTLHTLYAAIGSLALVGLIAALAFARRRSSTLVPNRRDAAESTGTTAHDADAAGGAR
jgi:ABC-type uncharacterized transport system involved in gliding motility auxiliary subunit